MKRYLVIGTDAMGMLALGQYLLMRLVPSTEEIVQIPIVITILIFCVLLLFTVGYFGIDAFK